MELLIRILLMFFFIQFLVVVAIMTVALLLAMPEVPMWGSEPGTAWLRRSIALAFHLPIRGFRSLVRRVQSMHLHSAD
jgi:hypothetical protein